MQAALPPTAKTIAETSEFNLILMTEDADVMKAAVDAAGFKRPLMYAATEANLDDFGALAKDNRSAPGGQGRFRGSTDPLDRKTDGNGAERSLSSIRVPGKSRRLWKTRSPSGGRHLKTATGPLGFPPSPFPVKWPPTWTWKP